jgi:hypothetical protein
MAKKQDEIPADDAIRDENTALRAQQDQMLDLMVEMKGEIEALKKGTANAVIKPQTSQDEIAAEWEALKAEFADVPNIDVIEHRILVGQDAAPDIRLKAAPGGVPEPSLSEDPHGETCFWKLRWFNFGIEGRSQKFATEGYQKVLVEELVDTESIPNLDTSAGYVRKGERGLEVLGKIPRKVFEFKKRADAIRNGRMLLSESGMRNHVANAVAGMAGRSGGNADQAGTTVHDQFKLTITPQERERVTI